MDKSKIKVGFVSLGCSKNLTDTEVMLALLAKDGYMITPEDIEADVIVVNTCGFIESAKQEAIDSILDIAWLKKHKGLKAIIVTGCLAERYRSEIMKEMPEVDAVLGIGSESNICDAVERVLAGEKFEEYGDKEKSPLGGERLVTTPDYTAYLKIAEGCDNRCTYCAIPLIRGKMRSRTIEDIVSEAKDLEALGVKELNLIAQDTSRYGLDIYGEYKLAALIRAITDATDIPWIRLLYCYPDKITDELIREIKENDRVVKYIDLPVQHISDSVLARMNRHGSSATIKETIAKLRREIPDICIRTTVMVGFPGETKEDFEALCDFIKETKFERLGAFTYSAEEDTDAAVMPDQIDEQEKQNRYDIVMRTQLSVTEQHNAAMVGKTLDVLCEGFDQVSEAYYGRSRFDAPDIDTKIFFSNPVGKKRIRAGETVKVKITETLDYDLVGEAVR